MLEVGKTRYDLDTNSVTNEVADSSPLGFNRFEPSKSIFINTNHFSDTLVSLY